LMTDGLPALALSMEKAEPGLMRRKPRPLKEGLFAGDLSRLILASSAVCGLTLIVFLWALNAYDSMEEVRAVTFSFSILIELLLAFYSRSAQPIIRIGWASNPWLIGAAAIPFLLQVPLLYTPLRAIFEIVPLDMPQIVLVLCTAAAGFLFLELTKAVTARRAV
jgi:P-type Ca2+ transporter type 2C